MADISAQQPVRAGAALTRITDAELEAWERLAEAATPGPWMTDPDDEIDLVYDTPADKSVARIIRLPVEANAAFIAIARTAIPALLAEVRALRHERDEARARALEEAARLAMDRSEEYFSEAERLEADDGDLDVAEAFEETATAMHRLALELRDLATAVQPLPCPIVASTAPTAAPRRRSTRTAAVSTAEPTRPWSSRAVQPPRPVRRSRERV